MPLLKLKIAPGIQRDSTRYSSVGSFTWNDVDKVRFRQGFPEKIGGWAQYNVNVFSGTARAMIAWTDLEANYYLGIGTNLKYYIDTGGSLNDITPIRSTVVLTDPFSTTDTLTTVNVYDVSHGAFAGDFVTFSGASPVGGITINGEYQIQTVIDGDNYTITHSSPATSTAGPGGGSVTTAYQINTGPDTVVYGNGWGAGPYGGAYISSPDIGWGEAATVSLASNSLRLWSNDTYGQDLVINARDSGIYYWQHSLGASTRAIALSDLVGAVDVPDIARQVITTADEKILAFGCTDYVTGEQDRLLIRWSDTSNPEIWTPLETNSAGGLRIPTGSEFITAIETKTEILVWSDAALHQFQYIGGALQYGIQRTGLTTIAGPNAVVSSNDSVYWMGNNGFFQYNGRILPIPCSVKDYVFNNLNWGQAEKIYAGSNMSFNEVWWFYPSLNSEENDRFVVYNYLEQVWYYGTLSRTCWIDSGIEDYPRAAATDGYIYFHEYGLDDGSTNPPSGIDAYIESGIIEIGQGDNFAFAWRMIPDVTFKNSSADNPSLNMILKAQEFAGSNFNQTSSKSITQTATVPIEQFTNQTYFRLRGREITFRTESNQAGVTWRLGIPRIDVRSDGRR
jgi:hypothetical protein